MNIRSIQCPSCGSNLNVESVDQSLIYCMYCGASVQLETNRNKGYDMELGRLDARAEQADKILEEIMKIRTELINNSKLQYKTKSLPGEIAELKHKLSYEKVSGWKEYVLKPFGIGLGILFLGSIVVIAT